jgi:hypothetical protein
MSTDVRVHSSKEARWKKICIEVRKAWYKYTMDIALYSFSQTTRRQQSSGYAAHPYLHSR